MTPPNPNSAALPDGLPPLDRETLSERVYRRLKKALLAGRYLPGQVLTLRRLAEALGTSVMPVRDAVGRLAAERAFELLPNRCIRIPRLEAEESDEVWSLRALLEGRAASLAARRITDAEVEEISRLRDRVWALANEGDLHATLDHNDTLQFAIYRAARSPALLRLIETLRMQTAPECTEPLARLLAERPPFFQQTFAYHDRLVECLARRDASGAMRTRREDLQSLRAWVRRNGKGQTG